MKELVKEEKKLNQKSYLTNKNLLIAEDLWQGHTTGFLVYKQLQFWVQARVAKGSPCFQAQSCL